MTMTKADGRPVPDAGEGAGSRWHGVVTAEGRFTTPTSPPLVPMTHPLDRYVRFFFPPSTAHGTRDSWVDTTAWATNQNGETGSDQVVATYTRPRRERRDGREVEVLAATWTGARSGSMPAGPDQDVGVRHVGGPGGVRLCGG